MAKTKSVAIARHGIRGRVVLLVACLLLLYVVVPQIGGFKDSFVILRDVQWLPVALACLLIVASYAIAGATYWLLALQRIKYGRTVQIQGASAFANRILPAGLGGLTLNVEYLRKQRHSLPQAIVVASTNNALGFVGHMLLLLLALAVGQSAIWSGISWPHVPAFGYGIAGVVVIAVALALSVRRVRNRVTGSLRTVARQFMKYRQHPLRLAAALCSSVGLTLITITVFYLAGSALGSPLAPIEALVVFTVGIIIGTAVPTPGGLGGVEAGLVAGSVAYGQEASIALAIALLFRLLTYWIPLLPGFILFMASRKYYSV